MHQHGAAAHAHLSGRGVLLQPVVDLGHHGGESALHRAARRVAKREKPFLVCHQAFPHGSGVRPLLPFLRRLVEELCPFSDLPRRSVQSGGTTIHITHHICSHSWLRSRATPAQSPSGLWEPSHDVYYVFEKELKTGRVILGHVQNKTK